MASKKLMLAKHIKPQLEAGSYEFEAELKVKKIPAEAYSEKTYRPFEVGKDKKITQQNLKFEVTAPRFELDPGLIYSVYPANGSSGQYEKYVTAVTFNRKTLPWERLLKGSTEKDPIPWFCILLFSAEEMKDAEITVKKVLLADFISKKEPDVLFPDIEIKHWDRKDAEISFTDVPEDAFVFQVPRLKDLPLLMHAKKVDMINKETFEQNPSGWFSVAIGSRLIDVNKTYTAYLVSLEGHEGVLNNKNLNSNKKVRLVVLQQWSFFSKGEGFESLATRLQDSIKPLAVQADEGVKNIHIKHAFSFGYMPVSHALRNGKKIFSWYRGPLVPYYNQQNIVRTYTNADQLLRFDKKTSLFDISYSCAWELGRLLALKNGSFLKALAKWKNTRIEEMASRLTDYYLDNNTTKEEAEVLKSSREKTKAFDGDELFMSLIREIINAD